MITAAHHIGCLVADIAEAINDYKILYPAAEISEVYDIVEQQVHVCFFTLPGLNIEFVAPKNEQSSLHKMLKKTPGFYHIGVYTDDIDAEIYRLEEGGYRLINKFISPAFDNRYCAFLYNNEMHLVELIAAG